MIRHYLRWFELQRCKKAIGNGQLSPVGGLPVAAREGEKPPFEEPPSGLGLHQEYDLEAPESLGIEGEESGQSGAADPEWSRFQASREDSAVRQYASGATFEGEF